LRFRDDEERERYMDSLEQQMERQRKRIESTLDRTEGSGRATKGSRKGPQLPSRFFRSHLRPGCRGTRGSHRQAAGQRRFAALVGILAIV
jgi:hypothetical protein